MARGSDDGCGVVRNPRSLITPGGPIVAAGTMDQCDGVGLLVCLYLAENDEHQKPITGPLYALTAERARALAAELLAAAGDCEGVS